MFSQYSLPIYMDRNVYELQVFTSFYMDDTAFAFELLDLYAELLLQSHGTLPCFLSSFRHITFFTKY